MRIVSRLEIVRNPRSMFWISPNDYNPLKMAWQATLNIEASSFRLFLQSSLSNACSSASLRVLSFLEATGCKQLNNRVWRDGSNFSTLVGLELHLHKSLGVLHALQLPFSLYERGESIIPANDDYLTQIQTFLHNKKYVTEKKSLMCRCRLFFICVCLVHDATIMSQSTSTY